MPPLLGILFLRSWLEKSVRSGTSKKSFGSSVKLLVLINHSHNPFIKTHGSRLL
jgi:hypothetical protein